MVVASDAIVFRAEGRKPYLCSDSGKVWVAGAPSALYGVNPLAPKS